jgi:hypothetical protein
MCFHSGIYVTFAGYIERDILWQRLLLHPKLALVLRGVLAKPDLSSRVMCNGLSRILGHESIAITNILKRY